MRLRPWVAATILLGASAVLTQPAIADQTLADCRRDGLLLGAPDPACVQTVSPGFYSFRVTWAPGTMGDFLLEVTRTDTGARFLWTHCQIRLGLRDVCDYGWNDPVRFGSSSEREGPVSGHVEIPFSAQIRFWVECITSACNDPRIPIGHFDYVLATAEPF